MLRPFACTAVIFFCYMAGAAQETCGRGAGSATDMQIMLSFEEQSSSQDVIPDGGLGSAASNPTQTGSSAGQIGQEFNPMVQIRVELQDAYGGRLKELNPNAEGKVTFGVCSRVTYRLRITGTDIEELTAQNLQPGQGDRVVNLTLHRKVERQQTAGGTISASRLKIPKHARKEWQKGNTALAEGKLAQAREAYGRAVAAYPQYDQAYNNLGVALMRSGETAQGKAAFEKAVQINDHFARALSNLAKIALDEKRYTQALDLVKRSLAVEPLDPRTLLFGTEAAYFLAAYDESISYAHSLHMLPHAGMGLAHYLSAKSLEKQGLLQKAIAEYRTFLLEDPSDPNVRNAQMAIAELNASSGAKQ